MVRMDRPLAESLVANGLRDMEAVKFDDWVNEEVGLELVGRFVRGTA